MMLKVLLALCLTALAAVSCQQQTKHTPPVVRVYSSGPGEFGKKNTLICHVSGFHPPDIQVQLMKDGVEIPSTQQSDLAFKKDWKFILSKNVDFTPERAHKYSCRVTHGTTVKNHFWEPNM